VLTSASLSVNLCVTAKTQINKQTLKTTDMKPSRRLQQYILDMQTLPMKHAPMYLKVLAMVYQVLGRKLVAKLLVTSNRCDGCQICVKQCPNHALKLWYKNPRRNKRCKGCLLCVYYCPKHAFELPIGRLVGSFLLIFLPFDKWMLPWFPLGFVSAMPYAVKQLFLFLLWCVGYAVSVYVFNKISFLMNTLPWVKRIGAIPAIKRMRYKIHPALVFPIYDPSYSPFSETNPPAQH
jgi:Pyruvate/2-oxoacid:ferredoxin oxidoreductase delta subunit